MSSLLYADRRENCSIPSIWIERVAKVGNVAGNAALLAPTMFIPGVNTVRGAALVNGLSNAALTEGDIATRGKSAIEGAAAGGAGQALMRGIARVVRPNTSPEVRQLLNEGGAEAMRSKSPPPSYFSENPILPANTCQGEAV